MTESRPQVAAADTVPYYVRACALGIPAYLIGVHLWTWVFNVRYFLAGRADFRAMYAAGYLIRTGQNHQLYDYAVQAHLQDLIVGPSDTPLPFNHLAYESVLFAPLSVFTYRTAYFIFLFANICLLVICFAMFRPWMQNLKKIYWWLPMALFAAFLPIAAALIQGQDSILLLVLLTASFVLLQRDQPELAGALAGLGMFKFQLVLPIALMFLLWRRWKFVAGFTAISAMAVGLSTWLVGVAQTRAYGHLLLAVGKTTGQDYLRNVATPNQMPNLRGLVFGATHSHLPMVAIQLITAISSAALFFWLANRRRIGTAPSAALTAITAAVLVSYHLNIHDLSVLFIAIVYVLNEFTWSAADVNTTHQWIAGSAALAFCAPLAESFFPDHLYLAALPIIFFLMFLTSDAVIRQSSCGALAGSEPGRAKVPHSPVL
jgi:Glycosyltransferase family 87